VSATSIAINTTATVTIVVRDRFGNLVKAATPAAFALGATAGRGTFSAVACGSNTGICTATYTAPATAGVDQITAKILTFDVVGSPINLTITP